MGVTFWNLISVSFVVKRRWTVERTHVAGVNAANDATLLLNFLGHRVGCAQGLSTWTVATM